MIAFNSFDGSADEIFLMGWDGTGRTQLTDNAVDDDGAAWSPDGSKIAFSQDTDAGYDIFVMSADGSGTPTNITNIPGDDLTPTWSPDGSRIAFASQRDGDYLDLYTMEPDGSNVAQLVDPGGYAAVPSWSPDGSKIAYYANESGNFDIFVVPSGGGIPERLTDDPARDASPSWSPDGQFITFYTRRDNADPFNCGNCNEEVYIMDAVGDDERRVTDNPNEDESPDWQRLPSVAGDSDCDGEVDSVDALHDLRYVAAIGQPAACIVVGNVSCLDGLTSVDSLFILRYVAQLPVNLPSGCRDIGS
jgi:TolB protein